MPGIHTGNQIPRMNICFYGVGGVGGYFGALIAHRFALAHTLCFVARGAHKEAICRSGLTLKKSGGAEMVNVSPSICTDTITDLPICDIIVLSVKGYDLASAAKDLVEITHPGSIVLPLLNGVDIYDRIRAHLSTAIVLPSCVYIGTHIESPGVILQNGGNSKIVLGADPRFPEFYPESLLTILQEAKISFAWEENVQVAIWEKFMFIAAYGLVAATYDKTLGAILEDSELSLITKSIMYEIESIAKRLRIPLSSEIVAISLHKAKQFPYHTKTSFQRDVESKGRINEVDIFGGTVIRYGDNLQIPVPATKAIVKKLTTWLNDQTRMSNG